MVIIQAKPRRKASGSRYKSAVHKKALAQFGSVAALTKLSPIKVEAKRVTGGHVRRSLNSIDRINVFDPATKKYATATIKTIIDNAANKNFVRRNIMTKGAILETSVGKVRITSRPGQEGRINGVLMASK